MQASYGELIDDHVHIVRCADLLMDELGKADVRAERLVEQMYDLAMLVRDHIAVEKRVVALCDAKPLPSPWRAAWVEGRDRFERLCRDWQAFLDDWTADAIEADPTEFRQEADAVLGRLKERVELETTSLYAVALQTGAIMFR